MACTRTHPHTLPCHDTLHHKKHRKTEKRVIQIRVRLWRERAFDAITRPRRRTTNGDDVTPSPCCATHARDLATVTCTSCVRVCVRERRNRRQAPSCALAVESIGARILVLTGRVCVHTFTKLQIVSFHPRELHHTHYMYAMLVRVNQNMCHREHGDIHYNRFISHLRAKYTRCCSRRP